MKRVPPTTPRSLDCGRRHGHVLSGVEHTGAFAPVLRARPIDRRSGPLAKQLSKTSGSGRFSGGATSGFGHIPGALWTRHRKRLLFGRVR